MRKIWLIAFLFYISFLKLIAQENPFTSDYFSETDLLNKVSGRIKLEVPYIQAEIFTNQDKIIWEADILLGNKKNALTTKLGNLTFSGSWSNINTPSLSSTITPFGQPNITSSVITANCDNNSFSKPFAIFSQYSITQINKNNFSINALYIPQNKFFAFSSQLLWYQTKSVITKNENYEKQKQFYMNVSGGLFPYKELTSDSWFLPQKYYAEDVQKVFSLATGLKDEIYKINFDINYYTTPQNCPALTLQNNILFEIQNYTIGTSIFFNPTINFFTPGTNTIQKLFQLKINIQKESKKSNFLTIKQGITFYDKYDFAANTNNMQISSGINLSSKEYSGTISSNIKMIIADNFSIDSFNIKMTNNFSKKIINFSINLNTIFLPQNNFSYWETQQELTCNVKLKTPVIITGKFSGSLKEKDFSFYSFQIDYGVSASYTKGIFTISLSWKDQTKLNKVVKF